MIKHLLVPTDGSEAAVVGIKYAIAVAKQYGAVVHGFHVVDVKLLEGPFLRDISASLGTAPYVNYQGNIAMILEERGQAALDSCEKLCAEAGITCETTMTTGVIPRAIVQKSELADIIVMGRGGEHDPWLEGFLGTTTQAVVRRAHCPVLITATETPGRGRFLIAYDGSHHAKRAVQIAAGISRDWQAPLTVLTVKENGADKLLDEARGYLDAHELPVDYVARIGDPSETIVEYAEENKIDLLVMGAYGHTKVREMVVGSTTAYVMHRASCPVLLTR